MHLMICANPNDEKTSGYLVSKVISLDNVIFEFDMLKIENIKQVSSPGKPIIQAVDNTNNRKLALVIKDKSGNDMYKFTYVSDVETINDIFNDIIDAIRSCLTIIDMTEYAKYLKEIKYGY